MPVVDDTSAAVLDDAMTSLARLRHAGLVGYVGEALQRVEMGRAISTAGRLTP